ncbi:hypothetical protein [Alicyclobacillus shizuokensis]|uniref:hypothetical protein n=1 Tax=Alicyclobacillus shizuokensis TaxID=392014 RepID=UPI00082F13BB|nr:hypothetical protein [Alicyclobacillus shizuokensis]
MTRVEALQALRTRLEEQGRAFGSLIVRDDNGVCHYCSVGHLLKIAGLSDSDIYGLQMEYGSDACDFYEAYERDGESGCDYVETLEALGLTRDELEELQGINDTASLDVLLHYVDELIQKSPSTNAVA